MKLKIDNLQLRDLFDTGTPHDPQDPALRIRIGNNEMMTKRSVDGGTACSFGDMFEIEVDEYEYKDGKLEIEVEVINLGSEQNRGQLDKNVHVGFGRATLHSVVPQFDNEAYFIIDLTHYNPKGNFKKGEVLMRGFLHDPEAIREALKFKTIELENLKTSYADYITSSSKMEADLEEELRKAEAKIQKLTKKNGKITETLTTVTEQYNEISTSYQLIQEEVYVIKNDPNYVSEREASLMTEVNQLKDQLQQRSTQKQHDPDAEKRERELKEFVNHLQQQLDNKEAVCKALDNEVNQLKQQQEHIRNPHDTVAISQLTDEVGTLQRELDALKRLNQNVQQQNGADESLIRDLSEQVNSLTSQLNLLQFSKGASTNEEIERLKALLFETKSTASALIESWKKQYYDLMEATKNDKDRMTVLGSDLTLTQRNVERVAGQLREQQDVNERLLAIIKIYEKELAISAKQELPIEVLSTLQQ